MFNSPKKIFTLGQFRAHLAPFVAIAYHTININMPLKVLFSLDINQSFSFTILFFEHSTVNETIKDEVCAS